MDPYENLIKELSDYLGIIITPDHRQSCLLRFPEHDIALQIDLDTNADQILIGCEIGNVPPGIYRERIFRTALRTNALTNTRIGTLAYSERKQTLILFKFLILNALTGEILYQHLQDFVEHATIWKESLKNGMVPLLEESASSSGSGMFGL